MTTAQDLPPHGKRPRYLRGCRCAACIEANKRYCKQYRVKTVHHPVRIDATPVRELLQSWYDQGYSHNQIGEAVGKRSGDISKILRGQPTIAPRVAARILRSAGPTGTPTKAMVNSTGTIRRGQALHAIGYPIYVIAEGVPMATNHLGRILDRQPATVTLAVAEGMTALYSKLRWRPGSSHLAVHSARRRGWHGPLAWDNIDDPTEQPETDAPYAEPAKYRRDPDRKAEIEHLYLLNESVSSIAKKLGSTEKYVHDQLSVVLKDREVRLAKQTVEAGLEAAA